MICLGVIRRPSDVGGEHDVGHRAQGVIGRKVLTDEMIEAGATKVTEHQRVDQRVGVVQNSTSGVDVERALAHARELLRSHQRLGLRRHLGVHRHDVGLFEQLIKGVGGVGVVRVIGDHPHPEALQAPLGGLADRAEADEPGGAPGQLPGAKSLVGDGVVAPYLARAHVEVGAHESPVDGKEHGDGHLGHGVGVAPGRVEHGNSLGRCCGDVDVGGVASARPDGA